MTKTTKASSQKTFTLNNIEPAPLRGLFHTSQVWNNELQLFPEQACLVLAPSGKGKSTFLHILYGLRKDFTGQLQYEAKDADHFDSNRWAELRTNEFSIVFQDLRLFGEVSAIDNIQLKNQLTNHKTETQIKQMADRLGVGELLSKKVSSLSYGQRQRMAIVRALCQPFSWLLLDEPFSHLDEDNTRIARDLILEEVEQQNAGMILVSLGEDFGISFDRQLKL